MTSGRTDPVGGWSENASKRLYVWFDAVIGYLSASIEWARQWAPRRLEALVAVGGQ